MSAAVSADTVSRERAPVPPLLQTSGLSVHFGGVVALDRVDLVVRTGEIVGVIGPNGAGKTTAIDAITGFVRATGRIEFAGTDISSLPPHRRARAGLGRTWQSVDLFDDLTVGRNMEVAPAATPDHVEAAVRLTGIAGLLERQPAGLSHGDRVMVGVARALAAGPRLVCLDEPAAGLDAEERQRLRARLRDVVDAGITVLLVDHDVDLMVSVCDRMYALETGVVIAEGAPAEVVRHERVVEAYLGRSA